MAIVVNWKLKLSTLGLLLAWSVGASAVTTTANIPVTGTFGADVGISGSATLNSATGTFKQWLLFGHVNIGVSASSQTVGVNLASSGALGLNGDGTVNLTYDDFAPGTPLSLTQGGPPNAIDLDLNGSGGANVPIDFDLNIDPLMISTSLGNFNLNLSLDGLISDFTAVSAISTPIGGGGVYLANPTALTAVITGNINAVLTGVPIIGNVNLGTIFTLPGTPLSFDVPLPGTATTSDVGAGPFPHDMLAEFQFSAPGLAVPFPLTLPLDVNQSASVPNGQSGFSSLIVDADLNAIITLGNVAYDYSGIVPNGLAVPEPAALSGMVVVGLAALASIRRRRR